MIMHSIISFMKMLSLEQAECDKYCRDKRYERYQNNKNTIHLLKIHALAHHFLVPVLRIRRKLIGQGLIVLKDSRIKTDKAVIFCPTHIGGMDVEMSFEAIKTPCWLLLGDPKEIYKSIDGLMLQMNGLIALDTGDKKDRQIAKKQMETLLKKKGNLLMFPEGAWNISPNLLLNHLYVGAVELAITCNAVIVPIALEKYQNTYYYNIGSSIDYSNYSLEDRYRLTNDLRDQMATLKWELMEQFSVSVRKQMQEDGTMGYYIPELNTEYTWTVDEVYATQFHPKGVISPKEAFSFMNKLIPSRSNAFLFRAPIGVPSDLLFSE